MKSRRGQPAGVTVVATGAKQAEGRPGTLRDGHCRHRDHRSRKECAQSSPPPPPPHTPPLLLPPSTPLSLPSVPPPHDRRHRSRKRRTTKKMRLRDLATYHYKVVQRQRGGGSGAGWDEEWGNSGVRDWEGGAVERAKATPHAVELWRQRLPLPLYVLRALSTTQAISIGYSILEPSPRP